MVISACTHPWYTSTFNLSLTKIHLLQLKIHNIWMKSFWSQKVYRSAIIEILTLKSLSKLFLVKLSADIRDSSFVLDSLLKATIFSNFSAGNSFLFFEKILKCKTFLQMSFYCKFSCLKKADTVIFNFSLLQHKNKCFW